MATDSHQIELNDHQRELLASAADQMGVPWPVVFENAIRPLAEAKHAKPRNGEFTSPYDILARLGLIGCIVDTPADLSTNKKYMQGYGKND